MTATPGAERFVCSPGGSVAAGQRRLRRLLLGLAWLMLAAGAGCWWTGRFLPGLLCLAVALVPFVAWRMSGERMPLWIEIDAAQLRVRTRTSEPRLPLAGAGCRPLTPDERRHLEGLVSVAGVAAPSGGFDSRLLGEFELYASDLGNALLVETEERRLVLTPDEPERFVEAFRDRRRVRAES